MNKTIIYIIICILTIGLVNAVSTADGDLLLYLDLDDASAPALDGKSNGKTLYNFYEFNTVTWQSPNIASFSDFSADFVSSGSLNNTAFGLDLLPGMSEFTIMAWGETTYTVGDRSMLDGFKNNNEGMKFLTTTDGGSQLRCAIGTSSGLIQAVSNTGLGLTYSLFTCRLNATHLSLWVNTTQLKSISIGAGVFGATDEFFIGQNGISGEEWDGEIDEVMLFNRSLLDTEIADLWEFGFVDESVPVATKENHISSLHVVTGTLDFGNYSNTWFRGDDVTVNISENAGTPATAVYFNFTNFTFFETAHMSLWYDGSPAHDIEWDVLNSSGDWERLLDIESSSGYQDYDTPLSPTSKYNLSGIISMRIFHTSSGNPNHDLYIDYINVSSDTPPTIPVILSPVNGFNYSSDFDLLLTSTDIEGDPITFYVYINGTLNLTTSVNLTNFTIGTGYWNMEVSAFDGILFSENASSSFLKDKVNPEIIVHSPLNGETFVNNGQDITLNITFTDDRDLFVYNITGGLFNYSGIISGTSVNIVQTENLFSQLNTSYEWQVRICDSHTLWEIPEAKQIITTPNFIKFIFEDTWVKIESIGGNEQGSSYNKRKDRYKFGFDYSTTTSSKVYEVTTNGQITYLNSEYSGHLILNQQLWLDFEPFDDVSVEYVDVDKYRVYVNHESDSIEFDSVGFLNCVTESYSFNVIGIPSVNPYEDTENLLRSLGWFNNSALNTGTTAGVLLFFFLFIVLMGFIGLSEQIKIPALTVLAGLYGFFFAYLIYTSISAIVGVLMIGMSIIYMISSGRFM